MIDFKDRPDFTPCYTPVEMFRLGIFGGTYFKLPTDLPAQFVKESEGLALSGTRADKHKNHYGILSGSPLEWWLGKGLIHPDDPNGWVEWYTKFYYGRRHEDDGRQIQRFRAFITRHVAMLRAYQAKGKDSLKTRQNLLQWAWDHEKDPAW
jgi:hypothetical protein